MPALTRNITILFILLMLHGTLWAQQSKWDLTAAPKRCTVIIPSNVSLNLPTSDTYQIGFFVLYNNCFYNVGSTTYSYSSQGVRIDLGYDPQGIIGYKENQRLITLIRNTSNQSLVYGVEFIYQNDANAYALDGTLVIKGVHYKTWGAVMDRTLCQSIGEYEMKIPFGLKPSINFGTAIRNHQNEEGRYILDVKDMNGGWSYDLSITSPYITFEQDKYNFNLQYFPVDMLHGRYEICPGSTMSLPATVNVSQGVLTRTPIGKTTSLTLSTAGEYYFEYSFAQNGCKAIDTIRVNYKSDCINTGYPDLINPTSGQEVIFTKSETVRVYDAAMNEVSIFNSPCIWKGTDKNGNALLPGLYFFIHEDGLTHDITLMY